MGWPKQNSILTNVPAFAGYFMCKCTLWWVAWRLQRTPPFKMACVMLPLALLAHGALIYQSVLGQGDIRLGFGNSLSTIYG